MTVRLRTPLFLVVIKDGGEAAHELSVTKSVRGRRSVVLDDGEPAGLDIGTRGFHERRILEDRYGETQFCC